MQSTVALLLLVGIAGAFTDGSNKLSWQGRDRSFILRLPPDSGDGLLHPLVMVLHGGGGNAARMEEMTGLTGEARARGMIVAYPDGTGPLPRRLLTWNSGYIDVWARRHGIDDVGFLGALVESLSVELPVDPRMVFVTGISNGGMMTHRLAAELPGIFAAAAPVAGSIGGVPGEGEESWVVPVPDEPVSVLIVHGMEDDHVPYGGGSPGEGFRGQRDRVDMSVAEAVGFWVAADGCLPDPVTELLNDGEVVVDTYSRPDGAADVVLCTIVEGGHSWPGSSRGLPGDPPYGALDASGMILDFFLSHPRD